MANLGGIPLKTTFTPAPTCFSQLTDVYMIPPASSTPYLSEFQTQSDYFIGGPTLGAGGATGSGPAISCFPSYWYANPYAYFSPSICPSGYTVGCISTLPSFELTETAGVCCPSSWTCDAAERGPTSLDWLPWIASYPCVSNPTGTFVVTTTGSNSDTGVISTSGVQVNAFGVWIRWQEGDFATDTTTVSIPSTSSTVTSASPSTATSFASFSSSANTSPTSSVPSTKISATSSISSSSTTPTENPTTSQSPNANSPSSGAKAGIEIRGAAVAAALILFILR